jgi:hypothetical protein
MPITLSPDLLRWAPPPRRLRYARVGFAGQFPLPRLMIEESWGDGEERDGRLVYRRVSQTVADTPRLIEDALIGYGDDGLTDLGTWRDGVLSLWSPPQVVLPAQPAPGDTWEDTHTQGDTQSHRSVELTACTSHARCIVVISTSQRPTGTLVMRSHYADGEGFCGFEALAQTTDRPSIRMWSEAVTITSRRR